MRVLITRPQDDGEETARRLAARGYQGLVAPLLTVRFLDGPDISLNGIQAILATSANGVRALARRSPNRDVPVFAVGPQTAGEADKLGFVHVKSAEGDANALALAASRWADPARGPLLHVAGEGNEARLVQNLPAFTVRQEILYGVSPVQQMPQPATAALRAGEIDTALFFSPRSAATFRDCVQRENLAVEGLLAACISQATAAALAPLAFRKIAIASRPNQDALLALLD